MNEPSRLRIAVKWTLAIFLAFLLAVVGSVASGEVTLTATTWPPGQQMKPGTSVLIQVRGMEQNDGGAVQPKTRWHIIPAYDDDATMLFFDMNRQPLLFFAGQQPGPRTVFLQIESPGLDELPRCDFEYGVKPNPNPEPNPNPQPGPDPPPGPLSELWVIVVEESRDRTAEQAQILLDFSLRSWLTKYGHEFRLVDKDQPAADLREWIDRVPTGTALPYLFLAGEDGKSVWEGPLPNSKAKMLELVKKWGAEK